MRIVKGDGKRWKPIRNILVSKMLKERRAGGGSLKGKMLSIG